MPFVKEPLPLFGFTYRTVASSISIGTNERGDMCHLCGLDAKVHFVCGLTSCIVFGTPLSCN
jgi:hypothetical protein